MNAPLPLSERTHRLESLYTAINCIESECSLPRGAERQLLVLDLLKLAAEQTEIARHEVAQALDS